MFHGECLDLRVLQCSNGGLTFAEPGDHFTGEISVDGIATGDFFLSFGSK
jgi:hypothetical protein